METSSQDIRIKSIRHLASPKEIAEKYPISASLSKNISKYRETVENIIKGKDDRLLAIVGPCSIHDTKAAIEYAQRLKELSLKLEDKFFIIMRTYFEKPRTTVGWKGLIMDPDLDESYNIEKGIETARKLLLDISEIGLPLGCEVLDPIIPQYIDELMSWSSIGARTTESQTHRTLASGLSVPVGFKNSTSGELKNAINAIKSASFSASFIGIDKEGKSVVLTTKGNDAGHLILRGGENVPNYYEDDVEVAISDMVKANLKPAIVIDCSHSNSKKDYKRQKRVLRNVVDQILWGNESIRGFMLESNIKEGSQSLTSNLDKLEYGVSITDSCISFEETEKILIQSAALLRCKK